MSKAVLLIATRDTHMFRKGQKLWQDFSTGALASFVVTRFRGKGRWIKCWAHYADKDGKTMRSGNADAKYVGNVEVSEAFAKHIERVGGH